MNTIHTYIHLHINTRTMHMYAHNEHPPVLCCPPGLERGMEEGMDEGMDSKVEGNIRRGEGVMNVQRVGGRVMERWRQRERE